MTKHFRFGLRPFLLFITGLCVLLALEVNRAKRHERATGIIIRQGGTIVFKPRFSEGREDQSNWTVRRSGDNGRSVIQHLLSRPWKVELHTHNYPATGLALPKLSGLSVVSISGGNHKNDALLEHLAKCRDLKRLALYGTHVADDDTLEIIKRLHNLQSLLLRDTKFSDEAVEELRRSLPICEITKQNFPSRPQHVEMPGP